MEPEKDTWINDVMSSLDGLSQAEPSPFLFARIRNRLLATLPTTYVPTRLVWIAAASFALLTLLNWQVINATGQSRSTGSELTTLITGMQLYPASTQLYDAWSEQNY